MIALLTTEAPDHSKLALGVEDAPAEPDPGGPLLFWQEESPYPTPGLLPVQGRLWQTDVRVSGDQGHLVFAEDLSGEREVDRILLSAPDTEVLYLATTVQGQRIWMSHPVLLQFDKVVTVRFLHGVDLVHEDTITMGEGWTRYPPLDTA